MTTIVVRPGDSQEEIKQNVASAKSGDVVKFSAGEYPGISPFDLELADGVVLRIGGCTFTAVEEAQEPAEEAAEDEEATRAAIAEAEEEATRIAAESEGKPE